MTIRSVSYGGGVQSTALLVLAAQGRIDFPLFLFSNVGDDSEAPATLRYVREVAMPYAQAHGIELVELHRKTPAGDDRTLWEVSMNPEARSIRIPVRMSNGAPGSRSCTSDFKISVISKELRRRGAKASDPAVVGIGFSLDEIHRISNRKPRATQRLVYPLVGVGEETGLHLRRSDCERVIRQSGLPVPGKSSCFFCPFHTPAAWADQARSAPDLFAKSCALEERLNETRAALGRDPVYLSSFGRPLADVVDQGQDLLPLFDQSEGACDSGHCFL